ncbi:MAG: hypothetical protein F6J98_23165 [Moorea sp. SIO4G2]|uniref:hypothetical protein n=1 Tax=unclassified Moorena TaxID=2683338 RepID=UPI0013FCC9AD|nr:MULTISPECIES: hypothetical protein [unclassified Moorena]NEO12843.1 hypothetical protein [Moorena sp. SIO3E8]NEO63178.1 hypothetical protein [Moorena sp. SIO4G2]NEQ01643.1 hypothetical protein [Moorena sp. SIO3F7]
MANVLRILFKQDSYLKQEPIQSSQLPDNKRQMIPAGTILVLRYYGQESGNHLKLGLKDIAFKGFSGDWYAFEDHVAIMMESIQPVETVSNVVSKQEDQTALTIPIYQNTLVNQPVLLNLLFNQDTVIKRAPIQSNMLNEASKQEIPAGTDLVIVADQPDVNNTVKFTVEENHIKFTLKDLEFKGFSEDWYAFAGHVGIQGMG